MLGPNLAYRSFFLIKSSDDFFVISFPKSGATWVGFLLSHLERRAKSDVIDLNSLQEFVPDVNRILDRKRRVAVRDLWHFWRLRRPRFFRAHVGPNRRLRNVIYLVRDPRDVVVSYWHYLRKLYPDLNLSMEQMIRNPGMDRIAWEEHVAGWLRSAPDLRKFAVIKYEDFLEDTRGELGRLASFCGLKIGSTDIDRAVELSTFEKMQEIEDERGGPSGSPDKSGRFVRRGKSGSWRVEMDERTRILANARFLPMVERLGYDRE